MNALRVWRSAFGVRARARARARARRRPQIRSRRVMEYWSARVLRQVRIPPRGRGVWGCGKRDSSKDDANKFSGVPHRSGAFV